VLVAWASWCKPCIEHLAKLDALAAEHPDWKSRVEILPVSIDEHREDAADSAKAHHWTNFSAAWTGAAICDSYHINGVPLIYVIGRDGKIIASDSTRDISAILKEQHLLDGDNQQPPEQRRASTSNHK
jgi:thiol-disulfide isomerase/thioredoxin